MECSACGNTLEQRTIEGLTVDVCNRGCGGIWFERFELSKVDEPHESAGEALLDIPKNPAVNLDAKSRPALKCPDCGTPMRVHFFSVKKQVLVEECPRCAGIWLDAGELASIRTLFASQEERKKAAEKYFDEVFGKELAKMREEGRQQSEKARKIAYMFRFICPSYYIPGKQEWGAF